MIIILLFIIVPILSVSYQPCLFSGLPQLFQDQFSGLFGGILPFKLGDFRGNFYQNFFEHGNKLHFSNNTLWIKNKESKDVISFLFTPENGSISGHITLVYKAISDPRNNRVELILGTGEWGQGEIPETMIRGLRSSHLRGNSVPRME